MKHTNRDSQLPCRSPRAKEARDAMRAMDNHMMQCIAADHTYLGSAQYLQDFRKYRQLADDYGQACGFKNWLDMVTSDTYINTLLEGCAQA